MNDSLQPRPGKEPLPSLDDRLLAISALTGENTLSELQADLDEVREIIFGTDRISSMNGGTLVGGSAAAVEAVNEGMVLKLEHSAKEGVSGRFLIEKLWPLSTNFTEPEPPVLEAMKRRTGELEELFSVSQLDDALLGSSGSYIHQSGELAHPEFSWVDVSADNHTSFGITYKFYKQKPSKEDKNPLADMIAFVHIGYLNKRHAPDLVSEEYPYFIKSFYQQELLDNRYEPETSFDVPEELAPLLGGLAKSMIIEALVEQGSDRLEIIERFRGSLNKIAGELIRNELDPVKAREILEQLGIHDDPDSFRC